MSRTYLYIVDVETGIETNAIFTPTNQDIRVFSGEKSLFDFIATVVDSKHEQIVARITNVTKYNFGGATETFSLVFNNGNLELVSTGTTQGDSEVVIPDGEEVTPTV